MLHNETFFWYLSRVTNKIALKGESYPGSLDNVPVGLGKRFTWCDGCNAGLESCDMSLVLKFNFANKKHLPVQSGKRLDGDHIPDAPQIHIVNGGIAWVNSQRSLQKGLHTRPKAQSSQAVAPFSGGRRSRQSLAEDRDNSSLVRRH